MEKTIVASRAFPQEDEWVVDNYNCLAALLALADRQPSTLYLIARDDAEEDMPIEVVQEIAKKISKRDENCRISIRYLDSFLKPCDTITDGKRLSALLSNESFTIERFYGYLAKKDITELLNKSKSVISLGLAIKDRTDAASISSLPAWTNLQNLNVSVKIDMDVNDLMPLNQSFSLQEIYLTFPYLTDELVDTVRPVIDVLMRDLPPTKRIDGIYFPKSQLTAAGAWRLAFRLRPLRARGVGIEPCGEWQPDPKEKSDINDMFEDLRSVTQGVDWDVNWLYKKRVTQRKPQEVPTGPVTKKRKL